MNDDRNERKYNGWTNYETWAVGLWLDNQQSSYHHWIERAQRWMGQEDATYRLAEELKEELNDGNPLDEPSIYGDLLGAALSEVNWHELAEDYLDAVPVPDQPTEEAAPSEGDDQKQAAAPEKSDAEDLFGGVIFAYTRRQAIADGVLVDVTETARFADFRFPVAVTQAVWDRYVRVPEGIEGQDENGRLWDIVWMGRVALGCQQDRPEVLFGLHVRNDNREGEPPLATLKAVCVPDDDGSPCITIMLPDED